VLNKIAQKIEIIKAEEKDIPIILGFSDIFLRRDWIINKGYLLSNLKNGIILLAFFNDKIVGIGICKNKTLYLLYVHPKFRSRKIGSKLLQKLKPETIRARTNQTTGNPVPYYERLGYKISIPHDPKNRNICIMQKELA
jgi:GNAT superfamily N-acetyltransferase